MVVEINSRNCDRIAEGGAKILETKSWGSVWRVEPLGAYCVTSLCKTKSHLKLRQREGIEEPPKPWIHLWLP
jgi:hypothetical protein